MGLLSKCMKYPIFCLYDEKNLSKTYPNGFVTENIIGIPNKQFKKFIKDFQQDDKENNSASDNLFAYSYFEKYIVQLQKLIMY